ncbi:urease accessory UreF family protein [Oceanimonas sp. CHS3-5]|uniref:urease accessory protein UreF n=1 Tax=Oceanimonas sp. CHS3-5 TaxID=3068186 RepID=UPI00273DC775|nr:urease accessory UreF family protein [Oceanimonas sp. CHS3-5]MDP5291053.1 urease accessory UreF family protein [Oceanimonas sp. CHS3-5]
MSTDGELLGLLQLASPSLPIGGFAWSAGLESAIELGWVSNEAQLNDWLVTTLQGLAHLDLPVLLRSCQALAAGQHETLNYWSDFIRASRETRELLFEDEQQALALVRLLKGQGIEVAMLPAPPALMSVWALAAREWGLGANTAALGFAWSWLENQLAVAAKTLPLGQTSVQRLLLALKPELIYALKLAATLDDDQLGLGLPGQVQASALHETQYSRLFRS